MDRIFNFNAGPAKLPEEVIEESSRGIINISNSGMSILEITHRSSIYQAIHDTARNNIIELMNLSPNDYSVLFLHGGGSGQFAMLPMNFLSKDTSADYVNTGEWASRAISEANFFGKVNVIASSEDKKFSYLPKQWQANKSSNYLHITSNNTIYGTQYQEIPDSNGVPLVCDMSSDFLSKEIDFSKFALIYAGAQKNLGPAGVTIVVINKKFLENANKHIPKILSYKTHVEADSLYHTPPVFCVYVVSLVTSWLKNLGGLKAIQAKNDYKSNLLYQVLDKFPEIYSPTVIATEDRSKMTATFRLKNETLEDLFIKESTNAGFRGIKGHRSVGGCRIALYNAIKEEEVSYLADFMEDFAHQYK